MATTKKAKAPKVTLPAGFTLARTRLDGFFERVAGNSIQGILRGSFKVDGKFGTKTVFRVEVTEGETQSSDGEMIPKGGVVGIDETGYTSVLAEVEAGTPVYIRYEGLSDSALPASKTNPHVFTVATA